MACASPDTTPTYADFLAQLEHLNDLHGADLEDDCYHIKFVSMHLEMLRHDLQTFTHYFTGDGRIQLTPQMVAFISEVERVGVEGWMKWLEERRKYNSALDLMEEMRKRKIETLRWGAEGLQGEGRDGVGKLWEMIERLGTQLNHLDGSENAEEEVLLVVVRSPRLPSILEERDEEQRFGSRSEGEETSAAVRVQRSRLSSCSSLAAEDGSFLDRSERLPCLSVSDTDAQYPPPLSPSVSEVFDGNEDRDAYLLQAEDNLWNEERYEHSRAHSSLPGTPSPSPAAQSTDSLPNYVYIPLHVGFVIPAHNPRLPSLRFPTAPSVVHFPEGASRDQLLNLLDILRVRHTAQAAGLDFPPEDNINVIKVRSHEMEWELKNAIRKVMTEEEWNRRVGREWRTEGEGDTYIVSQRDICFDCGHESTSSGNEGEPEEFEQGEEENWSAGPRLRGGADVESVHVEGIFNDPLSLDRTSELFEDNVVVHQSPILSHSPAEEPSTVVTTFQQTWIEYARLLQMQAAAAVRLNEQLQEILADAEETILWQDARLSELFNDLGVLKGRLKKAKKKARLAREESYAAMEAEVRSAKQEAMVASKEAEKLRGLLNALKQIFFSTKAVIWQKDRDEDLNEREEPTMWELPAVASMRGGAEPADHFHEIKPPANAPRYGDPTAPQRPLASAFYFFPSASIIVLLGRPFRYFQWPNRTTLTQIRTWLDERHFQGVEDNAGLVNIRDILVIREVLGIPLQEMKDDKMVYVNVPKVGKKDDEEVEEISGRVSWWESRFGPDEYEMKQVETMRGFTAPAAKDRSQLLPPSPGEDGGFVHAGDLINAIDEHVSASSGSSGDSSPKRNRASPLQASTGAVGTQTSSPPPAIQSQNSNPSSSRIPSFHAKRATQPTAPLRTLSAAVPESSYHPHPAKLSFSNPIRTVRFPPQEGAPGADDELIRSANFDYEVADYQPVKRLTKEEEELLRHRRGEGCETWGGALEEYRTRCTFCDLPFLGDEESHMAEEYNGSGMGESVALEDDAPMPLSLEGHSSSEESWFTAKEYEMPRNSSGLSHPAAEAHIRGGAGSEDQVFASEQWRSWILYADEHRLPNEHLPLPNSPFSKWHWPNSTGASERFGHWIAAEACCQTAFKRTGHDLPALRSETKTVEQQNRKEAATHCGPRKATTLHHTCAFSSAPKVFASELSSPASDTLKAQATA